MAAGVQLKGTYPVLNTKSLIGAAGISAGLLLTASPALAHGHDGDKVTICHRTNSAHNPYVRITVDVSAVDGEGHDDHSSHTGPVFDASVNDQQHRGWGDIIPGLLNWTDAGQAIYANGCKVPEVEETPVTEPPTTEPPVQEPLEPPVVQPPVVTSPVVEPPAVTPTPVVPEVETQVVATPATAAARPELARTGSATGLLALTGCLLVAYGWLLRRKAAR